METLRVSVRDLIGFIMRSGDIDNSGGGFSSPDDMTAGTRAHRKLQRESRAEAGAGYSAEVKLSYTAVREHFSLEVEGIADGIFAAAEGQPALIDEIKTTYADPETFREDHDGLHWAQAMCYAHMYCEREGLGEAVVRLTYYGLENGRKKQFTRRLGAGELAAYFNDIVDRYESWAKYRVAHTRSRNAALAGLGFPFSEYRKGQREMAAEVYRAIRDRRKIFAQAPTGTGKTMSVLFPALKAMGEGLTSKIFYLTAKNVTAAAAEDAASRLNGAGAEPLTAIRVISKDRACPLEKRSCNPVDCTRAKGHYDRVNAAIMDIITHERLITRDVLSAYSEKHGVCPFEYSLDVSEWSDVVICDYNYVFDPRAHLRRYFEAGGDYALLVDEAHNLVERARDMFSAGLAKSPLMEARRQTKAAAPAVYRALGSLNKLFIEWRKQLEAAGTGALAAEPPETLAVLLDIYIGEWQEHMAGNRGKVFSDELTDLYFEALALQAVFPEFDEKYRAYISRGGGDMRVKLLCADPSERLRRVCAKAASSVFFSATLLPAVYFRQMLGGSADERFVVMPSPFERDNLALLCAGDISTKYRDRADSARRVAEYIAAAAAGRTGNYMVFFPSFEYLGSVRSVFEAEYPGIRLVAQESAMDDDAREAFLAGFKAAPDETLVGFAVMGGIFSEGIDLTGDRLSGAVIVGVGLPQLSFERGLISEYFSGALGAGFEYAYMYPGLNRVLQAAGRVIRGETDRGFVLLLDKRFLHRRYLDLFPAEWSGYRRVKSPEQAGAALADFWAKKGL